MYPGLEEIILKALTEELERQRSAPGPGPYIDLRSPSEAAIDGTIDLKKLAQAVFWSI